MEHTSSLMTDLALILGVAAVASLIFRKLNQPVVLGYLLAGLLVGPNTNLLPSVADYKGVQLWAELGVIFLLFALGLEFSFKKLVKEGSRTGIVTFFEVSAMLACGFGLGKLIGWSNFDSLFLGGIVSISSTSIILRVFDEFGFKNKKFVGHVFGVLIFEDIAAVLLLVLLSTIAVSQKFAGLEMISSLFKLIFFLSIWFISGVFLIPGFIRRMQKYLSEEVLLICGLGFCLMMASFASAVGFSSALGAFIAGSLLSETAEGEKIHRVVMPVRDLFSAVFFVSVGMLISPAIVFQYWKLILGISMLVIVGKTVFVTIGSVFIGQSFRNSVSSGLAMSQIGEFSFIIASLGLSLGVISERLYPIAVAISVLTSFLTPSLIRHGEKISEILAGTMPKSWVEALDEYSIFTYRASGDDVVQKILINYTGRLLSNSIIVIGLFILSSKVFLPWLLVRQFDEPTAKLIAISIELILSAPFLWAISFAKIDNFNTLLARLSSEARKIPTKIFIFSRIMISAVLLTIMISQFVSSWWAIVITIWLLIVVGYTLSSQMDYLYKLVEKQFLRNLDGKSSDTLKISRSSRDKQSMLVPWEAHIVEFRIDSEWLFAGKQLDELSIRENYGVTITLIERGRNTLPAPMANEKLYPMDLIHVIGSESQLLKFQKFLEIKDESILDNQVSAANYGLETVLLNHKSDMVGKSIRESGLRERIKGLLVGIERGGVRLLNPPSTEIFMSGDLVWLVGDTVLIRELRHEKQSNV